MSPNIVYLGLVSFFTDFATALINPILPIFVTLYLGADMKEMGIIVAASTFVSYFLRVFAGVISERLSLYKAPAVLGYAISTVAKPLISSCDSYRCVALLKSAERLGKAVRSAPKDAIIAFCSSDGFGKSFGFHKTLDIAGETAGTLTLFAVLFWIGTAEETIRTLFAATIIPGTVALAIMLFLVKEPKIEKKSEFRFVKEDIKVYLSLVPYFLTLFFLFNESFFAIRAERTGIEIYTIPLLFLLSSLTQTASSYRFGLLLDKIGYEKSMALALFFAAISQAALALSGWSVWISFVFLGLFTVLSLNSTRAYIASKAKQKAFLYGLFYASVAVSAAGGALVEGWLWERMGFAAAEIFAVTGTVFIWLLYLFKALNETRS